MICASDGNFELVVKTTAATNTQKVEKYMRRRRKIMQRNAARARKLGAR